MFIRSNWMSACLVGSILVVGGCGGGQETDTPEESEVGQTATTVMKADVEVTEAMAGMLAIADELDGTEDKTVGKCASCMLKMDGSAEYALEVGDYTMHFCKEDCRTNFNDKLAEGGLALTVPEKPAN